MNKTPPSRPRTALLALALLCMPGLATLVALAPTANAAGKAYNASVPSDGSVVTLHVDPNDYTMTASGTYLYAATANPPGYADADYSWGDPTHPTCYDWPGNDHDLLVNGASPWQSPCHEDHAYSVSYSCADSSGCDVQFQIMDEQPGDNQGSLQVALAPVPRQVCAPSLPTLPGPTLPAVTLCYVYDQIPVIEPTLTEVSPSGGASHHVVGYMDEYQFTLPNGATATIPCVTLLADDASADPCAAAGGSFSAHFAALVDETASEPTLGPTIGTIAVCQARLEVKVGDFGLDNQPIDVPC